MFKFFILFSCVLAQDNFCDFYCLCGFETVSCYNVPIFPSFPTSHWIRELTIESSNLNYIPDFGYFDFIALEKLIIFDCPRIPCSDITKLKKQRPEIEVIFDKICFTTTLGTTTATTTNLPEITTSQYIEMSTYEQPDSLLISTIDYESSTEVETETMLYESGSTYEHTDIMLVSTSKDSDESLANAHNQEDTHSKKQMNVAEIAIIVSCTTSFVVLLLVIAIYVKLRMRSQVAPAPNWLELDTISVHTNQTTC